MAYAVSQIACQQSASRQEMMDLLEWKIHRQFVPHFWPPLEPGKKGVGLKRRSCSEGYKKRVDGG